MEREFIPLNIGVLRVLETGAVADDADVEAIGLRLAQAGHTIVARETVTDSKSLIREQMTMWIGDRGVDVIVAIGGIDSTPTDPMLDAMAPLVSRQFFGFGELFRSIVHEDQGTASIFSHAEAALCSSTYVILLPAMGFTAAAIDRLLIPQLDHRTLPRNLAMSLPRLQAIPQEVIGGDSRSQTGAVPRTRTGAVPVQRETTSRVAVVPQVAPPPAPAKRQQSTQIPPLTMREPAAPAPRLGDTPTEVPVVAPRPVAETLPPVQPDEPAAAPNAFAAALKEHAQARRTQSIVAVLPVEPPKVDLAALAAAEAPKLSESSSGTIDMDSLVAAAEEEPTAPKVAPRVTAPPPFVPRTTTSQVAVVPLPPPPPPVHDDEPSEAEIRALAAKPSRDARAPKMFAEGRRRKPSVAVVLLLCAAGLSVVVAAVVVAFSMMKSRTAVAEPKRDEPPAPTPVALIEPDAAVPMRDPVVVDAGEIEMPPMVEVPVDAGAPLALKPAPSVPVHDPVPTPPEKAVPVPVAVTDGCDEVSCVLDHYARACCAGFKPADPTPVAPTVATNGTPEKLDRKMVTPAVEAVKPMVIACGERPNAPKGTVKLQVHVNPDGKVSFVTVAETPDAVLGDCVSAAMQRAVFPATQTGGGFTYPFVF